MRATGAGRLILRRLFSSYAGMCPDRIVFIVRRRGGNVMARLRSAYPIKASVALVVATLVAATLQQAEAQDLSGAPIKLIVGVAAGDAADVTARRVAQKMSESLRTAVD